MATITLRVNSDEEKFFKDYAKLTGEKLSSLLKKALLEKIEDEYDITVAAEAYQEYVSTGKKSRPFSELKKELGL